MDCKNMVILVLGFIALLACNSLYVQATDPELTGDYFVPAGTNQSTMDAGYFTFSGFRSGADPTNGSLFSVNKAFSSVFTALSGLGVASAQLQFLPGGINAPHTHPRATEVLFVSAGTLEVGMIDSTNKLFSQTLQTGDVFVFPKGLVHYQINNDTNVTAKGVASFSSSAPGLVSFPPNLFKSGMDVNLLAQSFGVKQDVIVQLAK